MLVIVTKDKHTHDCTTQEQLDRFLAAGWKRQRRQTAEPDLSGDEVITLGNNQDSSDASEE